MLHIPLSISQFDLSESAPGVRKNHEQAPQPREDSKAHLREAAAILEVTVLTETKRQ